MGLFGRDESTDGKKPSAATSHTRQKHSPGAGSDVTLIARTSFVEGEIKGAGEVRIEGTFKGKLDCSAAVVIAEDGTVEGELKAETIAIAGNVNGNVTASQKIELTPTANVEGDITAPRILIREGATFEGQVFMTGKKAAIAAAPEEKPDADAKAKKD